MNSDYVIFWWQRGEFAEQIGDWQAGACWDQPGADLLQDDTSVTAMQQAPLGEPKSDFDVRCVYDSRIVNGYDFNFSAAIGGSSVGGGWSAVFVVPNGYRAFNRVEQPSPTTDPLLLEWERMTPSKRFSCVKRTRHLEL